MDILPEFHTFEPVSVAQAEAESRIAESCGILGVISAMAFDVDAVRMMVITHTSEARLQGQPSSHLAKCAHNHVHNEAND